MEPITNYESSDGTSTPIAELNNFHLVNALVKEVREQTNRMRSNFDTSPALIDALKAEVFKRMDNRPA